MRRLGALLLVVSVTVLLVVCGSDDRTAGGGINNPNTPSAGISGTVTSGGVPVEGVDVTLYRITYDDSAGLDWGAVDSGVTDGDGWYGFDGFGPGTYSVLGDSGARCAFSGFIGYGDTTDAADADMVLDMPVTMTVHVELRDSSMMDNGLVGMLVGTPYRSDPSLTGVLVLEGVPRGGHALRIRAYGGGGGTLQGEGVISAPIDSAVDGVVLCPLPFQCTGSGDTLAVTGDSTIVANDQFSIGITIE